MKHSHQQFSIRSVRIALAAMSAITFIGVVSAQEKENIGTVQQGLVGAAVVSPADQERYGLLTLSSGCSASLLRNNWAITAAHCVTGPENSVTLTANWKTVQERQSARIISFPPNDVAIIRVASPFSVGGSTTGYNRDVFRDALVPLRIMAFRRGRFELAQDSGAGATESHWEWQYREGYFTTDREGDNLYSYPRFGRFMIGGDSGGPSFANTPLGEVLVGVNSIYDTSRSSDAPIAPVWDDINRHLGAFVLPAQFIGTFGKTPPNYQSMWVYAIKNDGELLWYRKDTGASPWQGPRSVGSDWANFKDVIPAGGNSVYAMTDDGNLFWYQHNGFNDGARDWKERVNVGHGWRFSKIFSGGEGIVYAIKEDGELLWYRHNGYADGGGPETWVGPKSVGAQWNGFKDVFSSGEGKVYAVKPDGTLLLYQQIGWQTGERSWENPRQVGTGWANFRQIVPAGGGVILAITNEGKLLWYKHLGLQAANRLARMKETWEGPVEIGSGWQGFKKVFAFIPVASAPIVR